MIKRVLKRVYDAIWGFSGFKKGEAKKLILYFRYEILLYIFLSIGAVLVIYKMLFFIPKSWGSADGLNLRDKLSYTLGFIAAGFAVYKFHWMRKEVFYLKKIALLFYALHSESDYEIYGILEHRKAGFLPRMLKELLDLEDMTTEHGFLLYLSQLQGELKADPLIRELHAKPARLQELKEIIRIRE